MRCLILNGNPHPSGFDDYLARFALALHEQGHSAERIDLRDLDLHYCVGCWTCWWKTPGLCALKDDMAPLLAEVFAAEAVVLGSPVYIGQMTGQLKIFVDRLLPVLGPNFVTRLKKHPGLLWVFTQGHSDPAAFRTYMEDTSRFLGFLGFTPKGILSAVGTREKTDVEQQADVLAKARAAGAELAAVARTA